VGIAIIHIKLLVMVFNSSDFDRRQLNAIVIAATALPPMVIRAAYLILIQFNQDVKYSPILGDAAYLIGMAFAMELFGVGNRSVLVDEESQIHDKGGIDGCPAASN
jgi:ABC-type Fe3+ transport system permease subunit